MQRAKHVPRTRLHVGGVGLEWPELWPALAVLAMYALCYVQFAAHLAAVPFDLDQGEGYDAWSAWLINLGQLPYTSNVAYPYYSSNYPPLWSYLVSIPMAWVGPGLAPARLVSAVAALAAAGVLGWAAARQAHSRLAGAFASGFFLASPYVFHTTPLARVNSLALLAAVTGLMILDVPTRRRVLLGSLALVAALFTKPTTLDAVIAGLAAVSLARPRLGLLAVCLIGAVGALGVVGLMIATHGMFWTNVVSANANPIDLGQLWTYMLNFGVLHSVCILLAIGEGIRTLRQKQFSPWVLYAVTGGLASLSVAKWGAGESYYLSAIAAVSVLAGVWISRFERSRPPVHLRVLLGCALLIQGLLFSHAIVSDALPFLPDRGPQGAYLGRAPSQDDERAAQSIADQIRRLDGPVLSEDPSFAVMAGRPLVGNATHLRNLQQAGLWDPQPLVSEIHARKYAIVVLDAELYPEPVLAAIGQSYFLDRTVRVNGATYHVFLPGTE